MNEKLKRFEKYALLFLAIGFIFYAVRYADIIKPVVTIDKQTFQKVLPDLGMSFDEFQKKYNEIAIKNKFNQILLRNERIKRYGVYNLYQYSYAVMKVDVNQETKNISNIEVYGEYTKNMSSDEKEVLFLQQKQIFKILSEIIEINDNTYKKSVNDVFNSNQKDWNNCAVTLSIVANRIPHVAKEITKLYKESDSYPKIIYLPKDTLWMTSGGNFYRTSKNTKVELTGKTIILSNGDIALQVYFLEGIYKDNWGYISSSFL